MTTPDPELARRALEWCKRNDGGRLYARERTGEQPMMVVLWDNGGEDELGYFHDESRGDDLELICDLANWAVEQLVPSETNYYGTRTYLADEEETS